jgi:hypothetical protein
MQAPILRSLVFAVALLFAANALADASLVSVAGAVEIGSGEPIAWRSARAGDGVAAGESIRTGAGARAEIRLGDQRIARLYERSLLRIGAETTAQGSVRSVSLDEGASLFDLVRRAIVDEFEVRTPEIIVSVKGTRFLVEASAAADLASVFRGEVALHADEFADVSVRPGFTGRAGELEATPFADPWDAWETGAPAPTHALVPADDAELREALSRVPPPAALASDETVDPGDVVDGATGVGGLLDGIGDVATGNARNGLAANDLLGSVLSGATEAFPFGFAVSTAGGPNVTVSLGGTTVTLDQTMIDTVLTGDLTPLGALNGPITTLGVDPGNLAQFLDSLF